MDVRRNIHCSRALNFHIVVKPQFLMHGTSYTMTGYNFAKFVKLESRVYKIVVMGSLRKSYKRQLSEQTAPHYRSLYGL